MRSQGGARRPTACGCAGATEVVRSLMVVTLLMIVPTVVVPVVGMDIGARTLVTGVRVFGSSHHHF
jgi:hypothetical protein